MLIKLFLYCFTCILTANNPSRPTNVAARSSCADDIFSRGARAPKSKQIYGADRRRQTNRGRQTLFLHTTAEILIN